MRYDDIEEALMQIVELGVELATEYVLKHRPPADTVVALPGTNPPQPPSRYEISRQIEDLLHGSQSETPSAWEHHATEGITELAVAEPEASNRFAERTHCPLCRGGSSPGPGFALPLGLERHLTGRGRTSHCPVMAAGFQLTLLSHRRKGRNL